MPKRLIALNLFFGALGVVLALLLVRELALPRRLPPPPEPRAARAADLPAAAVRPAPPPEDFSAYGVIVSRHLFNPARSGAAVLTAGALPPDVRLFLYGVVVDGVQTRAYLHDPVTQRVYSYQVGDTVAGLRVERIGEDRVVMVGPEGSLTEVMLRDPSKPREASSTPQRLPAGSPAPLPGPPRPVPAFPSAQPPPPSERGALIPGAPVPPPRDVMRDEPAPPLPQGIPPQLFRPGPAPAEGTWRGSR